MANGRKIKTVGIVSKNIQPHIQKTAKEVINHLNTKKVKVHVERKLAKKLGRKYCAYKNRFKLEKANFDVLITLACYACKGNGQELGAIKNRNDNRNQRAIAVH